MEVGSDVFAPPHPMSLLLIFLVRCAFQRGILGGGGGMPILDHTFGGCCSPDATKILYSGFSCLRWRFTVHRTSGCFAQGSGLISAFFCALDMRQHAQLRAPAILAQDWPQTYGEQLPAELDGANII